MQTRSAGQTSSTPCAPSEERGAQATAGSTRQSGATHGQPLQSLPASGRQNAISVIQPALPQGGGAIQGIGEQFSPNEYSGSFNFSIPFPATVCRDLSPELGISYSPGNGNGPFGMGWSLNLASISRRTDKGVPQYGAQDGFLFGEPLVPKDQEDASRQLDGKNYRVRAYLPRKAGDFSKLEHWQQLGQKHSFWMLTQPDNRVSIFGFTSAARVADPEDPGRIYQWLLEESYHKGQHLLYDYKADEQDQALGALPESGRVYAQRYLSKLRYGNQRPIEGSILLDPASQAEAHAMEWHFELVLDYGEYQLPPENPNPYLPRQDWSIRPDPFSDYRVGFEVRTMRLCRRVLLFHRFDQELGKKPCLVKALTCDYAENQASGSGLSFLKAVSLTGYRDQGSEGYSSKSDPALKFSYSAFEPLGHSYRELSRAEGPPFPGLQEAQCEWIDLYADGIPGLLCANGRDLRFARPRKLSPRALRKESFERLEPGVWDELIALGYLDSRGKLQLKFRCLDSLEAFALPTSCGQRATIYRLLRQAQAFEIEYSPFREVSPLPTHAPNQSTQLLADISGNGQLDLAVLNPQQAGYYQLNPDGSWKDFRAFPAFPSDYHDAFQLPTDLNGDGLLDLLQIGEERLRYYPGKGAEGFAASRQAPPPQEPLPRPGSPTALVQFANICGTGRPQLVCIREGSVTCWPSLGYGKFAPKVSLTDAPRFGNDFQISRLRLVDIDGKGLSDIAYSHADGIEIWFNRNGNGFSPSIRIPYPAAWSDQDQIQFADLYGMGTSCLLFCKTHPEPRQWCYDFTQGQKPHLLCRFDNQVGAETLIAYGSSAHFALTDRMQGRAWQTTLPFPVQVVCKIEQRDAISASCYSSAYRYSQGHYDGDEREFRGFGRVDRTDAETFEALSSPSLAAKAASAYQAPPLLSKSWYHTGAEHSKSARAKIEVAYWNGDPEAFQIQATSLLFQDVASLWRACIEGGYLAEDGKPQAALTELKHETELQLDPIFRPWRATLFALLEAKELVSKLDFEALGLPLIADAKAIRAAQRALEGSLLRCELYGRDGTSWQDTPYSVSESRFLVRELQPQRAGREGLYQPLMRESLLADYERNPADPHCIHELSLEADEYGQTLRTASVIYPRRTDQLEAELVAQTRAQQLHLHLFCAEFQLANQSTETAHLLGVPLASKHFEILGLRPEGACFGWAELKRGLISARRNQLTEDQPEPAQPASRLLAWEKNYYFDPVREKELPFGAFTAELLHCRSANIEAEKAALESSFTEILAPAALEQLLTTGEEEAKGGFFRPPPDGEGSERYFWNPGGFQSFAGSDHFYLPKSYFSPFFALTQDKSRLPHFAYEYDPHLLLITGARDPYQNQTRVEAFDYQAFQPLRLRDANDNCSEVRCDPLGRVVVSTWYGSESGQDVGFAPLSAYHPQSQPTRQQVLREPERYLQNAASYFFYELGCWSEKNQPAHWLEVSAETFPDPKATPVSASAPGQIAIHYFDGFGRALQSKTLFDAPGGTVENTRRWLSSGVARYNNKGAPIQHFEPFFASDADYAPFCVGISELLFYDPLGRPLLVETPKTKLEKGELFSTHSKQLQGKLAADAPALPSQDPLQRLLYAGLTSAFIPSAWCMMSFDANDTSQESSYYRAVQNGTTTLPSWEQQALEKSACFYNTPLIQYQDGRGRTIQSAQLGSLDQDASFSHFQLTGLRFRLADARLQRQGKANLENRATLGGSICHSHSSDAGPSWHLNNCCGQALLHQDARGFREILAYDLLQRPISRRVLQAKPQHPDDFHDACLDRSFYFDAASCTDPQQLAQLQRHNLLGKAVLHLGQEGLSANTSYGILGAVLRQERSFARAYKQAQDWRALPEAASDALLNQLKSGPDLPAQLPQALAQLLEPERYLTQNLFDPLGRPIRQEDPDGNLCLPSYYPSGWLKSIHTRAGSKAAAGSNPTPELTQIDYNAKGQTLQVIYGNGIIKAYHYDTCTFRLQRIISKRGQKPLQNLQYYYDFAENLTHITDHTAEPVYFNNQKISAEFDYQYDALYRLIRASGREHLSMWENLHANHNRFDSRFFEGFKQRLDNGQALQNYQQSFAYDESGNLLQLTHQSGQGKLRQQSMSLATDANRLLNSTVGETCTHYHYDEIGNQLSLGNRERIVWNESGQIQKILIQERENGKNDAEYYVYDGSNQRVRKVWERYAHDGSVLQTDEVFYIGAFEIRRSKQSQGSEPAILERETHQVRLANQGEVLCNWRYQVGQKQEPASLRYQLSNHLGSSTLELDPNGQILSYEEYYPYGGTSFLFGKNQTEIQAKHDHYSNQEKDASTGLYYYGQRYYCAWTARWLSADPAGTVDGINRYTFVGGNPMTMIDVGGMASKKAAKVLAKAKQKYSQASDETLKNYLLKDQTIVGQKAVELLEKGKAASSSDVRVIAKKSAKSTMGMGLHEMIPTSERMILVKIKKDQLRVGLANIQSGLRSHTGLSLMITKDEKVAAHTGTFVSDKKANASLGTNLQKAGHDCLREGLEQLIKKNNLETLIVDAGNLMLASVPHAESMKKKTELIKLPPNIKSFKKAIDLFKEIHNRREQAKQRVFDLYEQLPNQSKSKTRAPSPPRLPFEQGGKYTGFDHKPEFEPEFPKTNTLAHQAAYISQPFRLNLK